MDRSIQGVPQGTVLGPLLFNLYVNDLQKHVPSNCQLVQFADDACLYVCGQDLEDCRKILSESIEILLEYFKIHSLTMNVDKTEFIILSAKSKNRTTTGTNLIVDNEVVQQKDVVKYLGVRIDRNLTLEAHVNHVLRKMAVGIKTICIIRNKIPLKSRLLLLHALVLSHVKYASVLFTGLSKTLLQKLEIQLNWGLRVCYFKKRSDSATELKIITNILPIKNQIEFNVMQSFWKLIHSQWEPFKLLQFPNYSLNINERTGALRSNIISKSLIHKTCFINTAIGLWNDLPDFLKNISNIRIFKKRLKLFMRLH